MVCLVLGGHCALKAVRLLDETRLLTSSPIQTPFHARTSSNESQQVGQFLSARP